MLGDAGGRGAQWGSGIYGAANLARVLAAMVPSFLKTGCTVELLEVNGQPGAILRDSNGEVVDTVALDILGGSDDSFGGDFRQAWTSGAVADAWSDVRETNQTRHKDRSDQ